MGLDSYLLGVEDDSPTIELGYWRSNGDLHVTIVKKFNSGIDNCDSFELTLQDLIALRTEVTSGNVFCAAKGGFKTWDSWSDPETGEAETLRFLDAAISFLKEDPKREVFYSASW